MGKVKSVIAGTRSPTLEARTLPRMVAFTPDACKVRVPRFNAFTLQRFNVVIL
jgi:hypothetical protein